MLFDVIIDNIDYVNVYVVYIIYYVIHLYVPFLCYHY
jgi:hypothetical protein